MGSLVKQGEGFYEGNVLDHPFDLKKLDDIWHLYFADHAPLELDQDEVVAISALSRTGRSEAESLNLAGINFGDSNELTATRALQSQVPLGESILLDVTTLGSALLATDKRFINPLALLDLGVVTFAFAMFDNVLVQAHQMLHFDPADSRFGGALVKLTPDREAISGPLWSICGNIFNRLDEQGVQSFTDAWNAFLCRKDVTISSNKVKDNLRDSPIYWDGVPATYYVLQLFDAEALTSNANNDDLTEFLSVQTIRALFNDQFAAMLGVPYLSTTLRSPVYSTLLSKKVETQMLADKLLARLGPETQLAPSQGPYVLETSAPLLLGLLLSRMQSPADYWSALQDLRRTLEPLRKQIKKDRDQWDGRTGWYLQRYLSHLDQYLPEEAKLAESALEATATLAASVTTASPLGAGIGKLMIKLVMLLKPTEKAYSWYLKRFKPDVAIVYELSQEAAKLRTVETEIQRLWKSKWDRRQHDQLEWLALNRPEQFSKLRRLG